MKNQYSKWALRALKTAEQTAKSCNHNYIGTEHLLAGLLAGEETAAGILLKEAGVTKERLQNLIEKLVAPSQGVLLEEPQGYTPQGKKGAIAGRRRGRAT